MGQGPQGIRDRFANIASIENTLSAANTLTFAPLATNMGFLGRRDQALAMVIDEIQYNPDTASIALMTATADNIFMALTDSDQVTNLQDLTDRRILDFSLISRHDFGTAASGQLIELPKRKQFFPPLITAARTLFLGVNSNGLATVITTRLRILFRVETLTGAELVELSEVFRLTA